MALEYTWKVKGIKVRDQVNSEGETLPNAIVQTYWEITGTDEHGHSGMFAGATPFTAENVPAGSFVPLADLTEEVVLGWIKAMVVDDYLDHVYSKVQEQIDEQHESEIEGDSLPWA